MRARTEETAVLIHQLYQPQGFWQGLTGKGSERQVRILREIAASGELLPVIDILQLAAAGTGGVAQAAASAVHRLVLQAFPDDLAWLDDQARYAFPVDKDHSWRNLRPADLDSFAAFPDARVSLLGVASMHPSGYVREKAVRLLAEIREGRELLFLLVRANDWVSPVREAAQQAVFERHDPEYARLFVDYIHLVVRLMRGGRGDHSRLIEGMIDLLKGLPAGIVLRAGLAPPDKIVRRMAYRLALESWGSDRLEALDAALGEQDPVIRVEAVRLLPKILEGDELRAKLAEMMSDSFPQVRKAALQSAVEHFGEDARDLLRESLIDRSGAVRETARFYLRKMGETDFASSCRDALSSDRANRLVGAISGLGETGAAEDAEGLVPFTSQGTVRVRKAALKAIGRLAGDAHIPMFLEALQDEQPGIRRVGREALTGRAGHLSGAQIWELLRADRPVHVRETALRLVMHLNKWTSLPYLLRAECNLDEQIAQLADDLLGKWLDLSNRSFILPSRSQMDEILHALDECATGLDEKRRDRILFIIKGFGSAVGKA